MPRDPLSGLFRCGLTFDLPDPREEPVRQLQQLGLLVVEDKEIVRCVNVKDPDQRYLRSSGCTGWVSIDDGLCEDEYTCPECLRRLFPSRKERFRMIAVSPDAEGVRGHLQRILADTGLSVDERPTGVFRVVGSAREVHVCLVDFCQDQSVLRPEYPWHESIVYVVGNDRGLRRVVPKGSPLYRIVDLALSSAAGLQRDVRQMSNVGQIACETLPLVPNGMELPRPSTQGDRRVSQFPEVVQLRAPRGSSWNQISVYHVDGDTLRFHIPGLEPRSLTAAQLGMTSRRSRERTRTLKWSIMEALCEGHGTCTWQTAGSRNFDAFKNQVSEIRKLLQHIVGIKGDPFLECSNRNGLRSRFVAEPERSSQTYVGEDRW